MKVTVEIVEILVRTVEVDASDYEAAENKVLKMYHAQEVVLDSNDFTEVQVKAI